MEFEKAKEKALGFISRRRLSKKELSDKLAKSGVSDKTAEEVVLWAEEYGFLNDFEYAKSYISDALNIKKHGLKKIRFDLKNKGIDDFTIDDALFDMGEIDETKAIKEIISKRLDDIADRKKTDKIIRFLASRGFAFSDIKKCLNEYVSDIEFGDDEFE